MTLFVLGVIVGWVLEYVVYTFWWKGRVAASADSSSERTEYEARISAKDREIAQLQLKLQSASTAAVAATQKDSKEITEAKKPAEPASKPVEAKAESAPPAPKKEVKAEPKPAETSAPKKAVKKAAPKKAVKKKAAPAKKAAKPKAPSQKKVVPLEEISGIGSVIGKLLRAEGFEGAASLADADAAAVQGILEKAEVRLGNVPSWIDQAKLIKAGDMEGLAEYKKNFG